MLEKQATSIEVSPLVLLKHAANLRGHVLEDTAEVLHSLARTSFEKQATSIEVSPLVLLKHAANLRGHVLEDTAEVLHSLARTSFGGRGIYP